MYQSNVLWPVGLGVSAYGDGISTDTHAAREGAEAVCSGIEREGFGGERRIFPIVTWVSLPEQPPRMPVAVQVKVLRKALMGIMSCSSMVEVESLMEVIRAMPDTEEFREHKVLTTAAAQALRVTDGR